MKRKIEVQQAMEAAIMSATEALHTWEVELTLQSETLENDRLEFDKAWAEFEEEKRRIMADCVSANDIIGTYLAAMFSGRWEQQLTRDQHGNVFFDEPPEIMMPLVAWLRASRNASAGGPVTLPKTPPGCRKAWVDMMDRFGLGIAVEPTEPSLRIGCIVEIAKDGLEWCKVRWEDDATIDMYRFADERIDHIMVLTDDPDALTSMVESPHPYLNSMDTWQKLYLPFAEEMQVYFDPRSCMEHGDLSKLDKVYDYVSFHMARKAESAKWGAERYSGGGHRASNLPLLESPLLVESDQCWVHFRSDASNVDWGYKVYARPSKCKPSKTLTRDSCKVGVRVCDVSG
mmetsp:Transcript_19815/g.54665  ORF Transcript_19815/g.54665 Transcript_19815/m.54665 type:complete len:344 (+) Transcript_19815:212-1243(+)